MSFSSVPGLSPGAVSTASSPSRASTAAEVQDYGQDHLRAHLRSKFRNFDDSNVYHSVVNDCSRGEITNFVVEFDGSSAHVALNLCQKDLIDLLKIRDLYGKSVRWINIWDPGNQKDAISAIGKQYGFSQRLTHTIVTWDEMKNHLSRLEKRKTANRTSPADAQGQQTHRAASQPFDQPKMADDLESGKVAQVHTHDATFGMSTAYQPVKASNRKQKVLDESSLAGYRMMQNTLEYTSIDQGSHFVCLGANWIHKPARGNKKSHTLLPSKHWSWYALCDDKTVCSFHEALDFSAMPKHRTDPAEWAAEEQKNMRRNTIKVLRQLSARGWDDDSVNIMEIVSVRRPLSSPEVGRTIAPDKHCDEGAANLFFYLFEDYSVVGVLTLAKSAMDRISGRILCSADDDWNQRPDTSNVITTLHTLNKELRQLHHLCDNYNVMIKRLLAHPGEYSIDADTQEVAIGGSRDLLTMKARNRFQRLQIQLQSLMIDTIKDYLDEKDSLLNTYFNLTNQRDLQVTERLTRSATLLAKFSVLFLPVSLMTSYFSIQVPGLFTHTQVGTYWIAFGVILGVSLFFLVFFNFLMYTFNRCRRKTQKMFRLGWKYMVSKKGPGANKFGSDSDSDEHSD